MHTLAQRDGSVPDCIHLFMLPRLGRPDAAEWWRRTVLSWSQGTECSECFGCVHKCNIQNLPIRKLAAYPCGVVTRRARNIQEVRGMESRVLCSSGIRLPSKALLRAWLESSSFNRTCGRLEISTTSLHTPPVRSRPFLAFDQGCIRGHHRVLARRDLMFRHRSFQSRI